MFRSQRIEISNGLDGSFSFSLFWFPITHSVHAAAHLTKVLVTHRLRE